MPIIYRLEKGSALSIAEIDENFRTLEEELKFVVQKIKTPFQDLQFCVEGGNLIVSLKNGEVLQRISLPVISFQHKGQWSAGETYIQHDVVVHEWALYLCKQAHMSTNFQENCNMWLTLIPSLNAETSNLEALSIFNKESLPEPKLGKIGFVADRDGGMRLVYSNGMNWRYCDNHEILS